MITPTLKDDALLADIASAPAHPEQFHLWWLGQSGFLLKWRERTVLFDPYLSDSLTSKYAGTDKEHIRMTERCIVPEHLAFVNVVTSSHAHSDHLDAETLVPLARARESAVPLVLPTATIPLATERLQDGRFHFHGLDAGESIHLAGFEFIGIPAAHDVVERDNQGRCRFLGFVVKFGSFALYHSGDTRWHDELPGLLERYQPDIVLVPINGHDSARRVPGNLNGNEAAALAKAAGASLAIPHHIDMFTFNTASPDEFVGACTAQGQKHRLLACGERCTFVAADADTVATRE